jgi:hypothetical protein
MNGVAAIFDEMRVGVGYFEARVCEHDWCQPDAEPAVVYLQQREADHGHYMCLKHFAHLVGAVAATNRDEAMSWR